MYYHNNASKDALGIDINQSNREGVEESQIWEVNFAAFHGRKSA